MASDGRNHFPSDLKSPATTVALLKMNAVVGLQATVIDASNHITRLGVTCALCHSTVDDSVRPGIGHRKDGWPNRDLNVGAIIVAPVVACAGPELSDEDCRQPDLVTPKLADCYQRSRVMRQRHGASRRRQEGASGTALGDLKTGVTAWSARTAEVTAIPRSTRSA